MDDLETLIWEGIARTQDYSGIHAGHFDYPCLRYSYYKIVEPELFAHTNRKERLRLWIGEALHEKRLLPVQDIFPPNKSVEYGGCYFTPDEYYMGILLEKKSMTHFSRLPKSLQKPNSHHVLRCEHYRMALELNNIPVKNTALLYIDYLAPALFMFQTANDTLKLRSVEETKATFDIQNSELKTDVSNKTLPPRCISWLCDYDPAFTKCFTESGRE